MLQQTRVVPMNITKRGGIHSAFPDEKTNVIHNTKMIVIILSIYYLALCCLLLVD